MLRKLTCIICPLGCHLSVETEGTDKTLKIQVSGHQCPRGQAYAIEEMTAPKRSLQSSIKVEGGHLPLVSVKTSGLVPKEDLLELMPYINKVIVKAPIKIGDVLIENILGLGVSIVATKNIEKKIVNQ